MCGVGIKIRATPEGQGGVVVIKTRFVTSLVSEPHPCKEHALPVSFPWYVSPTAQRQTVALQFTVGLAGQIYYKNAAGMHRRLRCVHHPRVMSFLARNSLAGRGERR